MRGINEIQRMLDEYEACMTGRPWRWMIWTWMTTRTNNHTTGKQAACRQQAACFAVRTPVNGQEDGPLVQAAFSPKGLRKELVKYI